MASPPPSPAMPKYKLADYRYGREEMLALYVKESKVGVGQGAGPRLVEKAQEHAYLPPDPQVPDELQDKEFAALLQEEPLQPLALEPLTEEEQVGPSPGSWRRGWRLCGSGWGVRGCLGPHSHPWLPPQRNFSLSVNSVAVLRLMGKGAGPPLGGASRGRGSARSRGRGVMACSGAGGLEDLGGDAQVSHAPLAPPGRGRGDSCFYQRSIEEGEGAFGRNPREIQRSQSWDDRCRLGQGGREGPMEGGFGLCHQRTLGDLPDQPWSESSVHAL